MPSSVSKVKVRGYHLDVFGVVNHARYLEFLEEARWAYAEERPKLAASLQEAGIGHSVVNLNIDYHRAARMGDVLKIETGLSRAGNSSITFIQKALLEPDGQAVISAQITDVFFELKTGETITVDHPGLAAWEELKELTYSA
jgi:thioesterase-3